MSIAYPEEPARGADGETTARIAPGGRSPPLVAKAEHLLLGEVDALGDQGQPQTLVEHPESGFPLGLLLAD